MSEYYLIVTNTIIAGGSSVNVQHLTDHCPKFREIRNQAVETIQSNGLTVSGGTIITSLIRLTEDEFINLNRK